MKISEYKTAAGHNSRELDEKIRELLFKGYQPYESPYGANGNMLHQAMVKTGNPVAADVQPVAVEIEG